MLEIDDYFETNKISSISLKKNLLKRTSITLFKSRNISKDNTRTRTSLDKISNINSNNQCDASNKPISKHHISYSISQTIDKNDNSHVSESR